MSHIITSQPRTPVTATYVILGTSIAYVFLWNITPDLLTKLLIISVFGGIITSILYYLELLQLAGNALLRIWYRIAVIKNFPEFMEVSYDQVFGEPYFERDRNKIYGILYLFVAIVIALVRSPISLSLIPLEIRVGAILGCVFLLVTWGYLVLKQRKRIKKVHYILALERYGSDDPPLPDKEQPESIVKQVKNELIAERWTSVMNFIDQAIENFYNNRLRGLFEVLSENKMKWQNGKLNFYDISDPFAAHSSITQETRDYSRYSSSMKAWLYVLDPGVHYQFFKLNELIKFIENKTEEITPVSNDKLIFEIVDPKNDKDLSYVYDDETFELIDDNVRHLHEEITKKIKKRSEIEPVPSINDVKEVITKIKELRPVFESIVKKTADVGEHELEFTFFNEKLDTVKRLKTLIRTVKLRTWEIEKIE